MPPPENRVREVARSLKRFLVMPTTARAWCGRSSQMHTNGIPQAVQNALRRHLRRVRIQNSLTSHTTDATLGVPPSEHGSVLGPFLERSVR